MLVSIPAKTWHDVSPMMELLHVTFVACCRDCQPLHVTPVACCRDCQLYQNWKGCSCSAAESVQGMADVTFAWHKPHSLDSCVSALKLPCWLQYMMIYQFTLAQANVLAFWMDGSSLGERQVNLNHQATPSDVSRRLSSCVCVTGL